MIFFKRKSRRANQTSEVPDWIRSLKQISPTTQDQKVTDATNSSSSLEMTPQNNEEGNTKTLATPMKWRLKEGERPVIIKAEQLEKTYDIGTPSETKALRGVNLEIHLGEIVVVFGSSGSGKSTLLNILAGLDEPTGGVIEVDGRNLMMMSDKEKALYHQYKVGMVFQSYNLVPTFTVLQNITMPARLAGFKRNDYVSRGLDLLRQFELEPLAHKLPEQCSGGQQQRVGIMRALMNRPAFVIADEPTGNLDSVNSQHTMELFKKLNEETNTTMVIVTHDPSLFAIADRVIHVKDGQVTKQTILTTKAKVNTGKTDVMVEYKIRDEKKQEPKFVESESIKLEGGKQHEKEKVESQSEETTLEKLIKSKGKLSPEVQRILLVLMELLTHKQQHMLDEEETWRLIDAIQQRVEGAIDHSGLQEVLDRPFADGGVGLYRQTAEHIASSVEAMLRLGNVAVRKKKRN